MDFRRRTMILGSQYHHFLFYPSGLRCFIHDLITENAYSSQIRLSTIDEIRHCSMRHLITGPHIRHFLPELQQQIKRGYIPITPNPHAARALGASRHFLPLQQLALELLAQGTPPQTLISPVRAMQLVRQSIKIAVNPQDVDGTTQTWLSPIRELLKATPQLPDPQELPRPVQGLVQTAIAYQQKLRQQQQVDLAELYWRVLDVTPQNLDSDIPRQSLLIYGYFVPSWDEIRFIDGIAGDGSIFYLPSADLDGAAQSTEQIAFLQKNGWGIYENPAMIAADIGTQLGEAFAQPTRNPSLPTQAISAHCYPDQETEARHVLAQIKRLLNQGVRADEIVIVAAQDQTWGPILLDIAWELGIPLRLPYQIPLTETRLGAWLTQLVTVIDQHFPYELTCQLLQHPLSPKLDDQPWVAIRQSRPTTFTQWQAILQPDWLAWNHLQIPEKAQRQAWISQIKVILQGFKLRQNAAYWAKESVAYLSLEKGMDELGLGEKESLNWQEFKTEFLDSLTLLKTVAYPGREGIELHNLTSIMGAQYAQVFVLDMMEGKLPHPVNNDAVLDFYTRRQLSHHHLDLANAAELARQESLNFYYLLQTVTARLTLSYATIDRQGLTYANGEPSSYFERLGLIPIASDFSMVASPEMARQVYLRRSPSGEDPVLIQAARGYQVELAREKDLLSVEYPAHNGTVGIRFDTENHLFSASQLIQLGQCPFKWFAHKVLKLTEDDEPETILSAGLRGNLYHQVLELALTDWQDNPDLDLTDEDKLLEWFLAAEKQLEFPPLPAWPSRRTEHIQILKQAIQKPIFLPDGVEVIAIETQFKGEWQGLTITGRVDRIDRTPQGLTLIDYKTSSRAPKGVKNVDGDAKIDLQLPLYKAVAAPALFPHEPVYQTQYYSLTKGEDISPRKFPTETELNHVGDRLKQHLNEGDYPVQPDNQRQACRYCSYDAVCRVQPSRG